jgi:oxygen-independent coproporphyrinogen-3 oxidase
MVDDVERAIADIKQVGFDVLNLDLIVGLTGETDRTFFGSLERVLELGPESITIYQLEIPHNTPLYRSVRDGETPSDPPDWAETRRRLRRAYARVAEAGYSWRSAYTAVRDSERHAFVYQDALYAGAELIGVGASSFGYLDGVHQQNVASLGRYVEAISTDRLPLWRGHRLSREERMVREFVLQLKLGQVDLGSLDRRFGHAMTQRFDEPLKQFEQQRLLRARDRRVSLSADGLARVDQMIPAFYLSAHQTNRCS